jgi:glutaredoxin 3
MIFQVFNKLNVKYTTIELDKRDDGDSVQSVLGEMTGARSVSCLFL